jgi:hypothetical protein
MIFFKVIFKLSHKDETLTILIADSCSDFIQKVSELVALLILKP